VRARRGLSKQRSHNCQRLKKKQGVISGSLGGQSLAAQREQGCPRLSPSLGQPKALSCCLTKAAFINLMGMGRKPSQALGLQQCLAPRHGGRRGTLLCPRCTPARLQPLNPSAEAHAFLRPVQPFFAAQRCPSPTPEEPPSSPAPPWGRGDGACPARRAGGSTGSKPLPAAEHTCKSLGAPGVLPTVPASPRSRSSCEHGHERRTATTDLQAGEGGSPKPPRRSFPPGKGIRGPLLTAWGGAQGLPQLILQPAAPPAALGGLLGPRVGATRWVSLPPAFSLSTNIAFAEGANGNCSHMEAESAARHFAY